MVGVPPASASANLTVFPRSFGDYELLSEIARGGMGIVYKAHQVSLGRIVALKVILSSQAALPDFVERFRVEARSAASLDHPNIVPIYEIGEHAGEPFFSMKLVEGETLAARNARVWKPDAEPPGPTQLRSTIPMVIALARAVHYAHQHGVLHRDIKPTNILLGPDDTPYLTDFGLAKLIDMDGGVTRTSAVLGTPGYMSPEQARGEAGSLTTSADVYGLGVVLYELLTGRVPFAGSNSVETIRMVVEQEPRPLTRLNPQLDPDLETVCLKCLEKNPASRYSSAGALADDLVRWTRHEPITARPATTTEKLRKWVRRRPGQAMAVVSTCLALIIVTVVSTMAAIRLNKARRVANEANARLEQHLRDIQWDKAEELAESGKTGESLAYLARLLRTSPHPAVPAARILSLLGNRSFPLPRGAPLRNDRGVFDIDFSPSGLFLATASFDHNIRIWNVRDQQLRASFPHSLPVVAVRFHPSEQLLVSACQSGDAFLWNLEEGKVVRRFGFDPLHQPLLDFSRDGRWLALRTGMNAFAVFGTDDGEAALGPVEGGSELRFLRFSEIDDVLVVTWAGDEIRLYDVASRQAFPLELRSPVRPYCAMLTPDGRKLVSGGAGQITVWDCSSGALEREIPTGPKEVIGLSISPDSQRVLSLHYLGIPRIWDLTSGAVLGQPPPAVVNFRDGAFSPDGSKAALASAEGIAFIIDGHGGKLLMQPLHQGGSIEKIRFSPDGSLVATASEDGIAQLWDVRVRDPNPVQSVQVSGLREAFLSLDGETLFTSSFNRIQRRSARTGEETGPPMGHPSDVFMARLSPDGKLIASISEDRASHLWEIGNGREITPPLTHQHKLSFLVFSPDSRLIVTTSYDRTARIWDTSSGKPLSDPLPHARVPIHADFHHAGDRFLTAGFDGKVRVWSAPEGRLLFETEPHDARIWEARFSPDGQLIASASADRTVRFWDATTGHAVGRPIPHGRAVLTVQFRPDGRALASATENGEVRVWDVATGQPISRPMRHAGITWNATFSADGEQLLTGAFDGSARVWDATSGYPISEWLRPGGDVIRALFSKVGNRIITTAEGGILTFWNAPKVNENVPEWFAGFVENLAGYRLNENNEMGRAPILSVEQYLDRSGDGNSADYYHEWVRSFLKDRTQHDR